MSIEAMKQARSALIALHAEGVRVGWHVHPKWESKMRDAANAIESLHIAIQQAEAKTDEPVGEIVHQDTRHHGYAMAVRATDQTSKLLPLGTRLYTHPAPGVPDDVARDAERYRWLRASTFPKADQYPYRISTKPIRLPIGFDDQSTFDAAIDAAMLTSAQAQKGQP